MAARHFLASGRRKPPGDITPLIRARRATRPGLTLLELILALALSVLVLMAVSMAINVHYRMLDVRRTNVEESQLARAALRHIADDLRSAVQYAPPDLSGLDAMSANMSGALSSIAANAAGLSGQLGGAGAGAGDLGALLGQAGAGGQAGGATSSGTTQQTTGGQSGQGTGATGSATAGGGQTAGAGGTGTGQSGTGSTASTSGGQTGSTAATSEEAPATTTSSVKLYGTAGELRFDISRLPRVDQYQALMTDDALGAVEIPSDVKTVVYFVRTEDSEFGLPEPAADGIGKGLMRTEIDRAVSSWAEENGDTTSLYAGAKLMAKEVTGLTFEYWDGAAWTTEWNSDELGGLPLAVAINLTIQPTRAMSEEEIADVGLSDSTTPPEERTYRLVVHLPTAISVNTRTLESEATETAAAEILPSEPSGTQTAGSGSSSGSGTGQTGGGGSLGTGGGFGGSGNDGGGRGGRDGGRGENRGRPGDNGDQPPTRPNDPVFPPRPPMPNRPPR